MRYELATPDKRVLIRELERQVGQRAAYTGIPLFQYQIGPYTVLRDGSLEGEPGDPVIGELLAQGLITVPVPPPTAASFPLADLTGRALTNLLCSLHPREELINKAIGTPDTIQISDELVQRLREKRPADIEEFLAIFEGCGGNAALKGLRLEDSMLVFEGFPKTEAWRTLAEMLVKAASTRKWMRPVSSQAESEKYAFRSWITFMGMTGSKYKNLRKELMHNLSGSNAYRLGEQQLDFYRRMQVSREPEFVLL